jgi:hypothetical protein
MLIEENMSSPLDMLLNAVKSSITSHAEQQKHTGFDPSDLLGHITGIFGEHQARHGNPAAPLPASQDPYGDPGAGPSAGAGPKGNVKPASQDPYGDPADQERRGS